MLHRVTGCGGTISQNSTHIQNPNYPSAYTDTTSCVYTFKKSSLDICSIRLDFVKFETRGPNVDSSPYTDCEYDTVMMNNYLIIVIINTLVSDDIHHTLFLHPPHSLWIQHWSPHLSWLIKRISQHQPIVDTGIYWYFMRKISKYFTSNS